MKILHIITQKPFQTGSGVYLLGLIKGLEKNKVENKIICGLSKYDDLSKINTPIKSEIIPVFFESESLNFPVVGMSNVMPYKSTRYMDMSDEIEENLKREFLKTINKSISTFNPDVILCQHLYLLTSFVREAFPNRKVFGVCHGSDLRQLKLNDRNRDFIKYQISQLDGIFSLHEEMSEEIAETFSISRKKVHTVGTGYSEEIFYINKDIRDLRDDSKIEIVFTGKLSHAKGVFELLKSIEILNKRLDRDIILHLIGGSSSDEEENELKNLIDSLSYKVIKHGILDQNEIANIYNKSHIFVLPSYYEGLPLVIPEALSCGLIAVSNDLPYNNTWKNEFKDSLILTKLPRIINQDEIHPEDINNYEINLANSLEEAVRRIGLVECSDIEKSSWLGLSKRYLDILMSKI